MSEVQSVYFIGIGGIGMSAIARYFNQQGATVSGYDKTETSLTKTLMKEGMKIFFQEDVSRIPKNVDLVVYTPAIPVNHTELIFYQQSDIPVMKRARVLGEIVSEGNCFAVAGSHGKSTTSAMLAHVFQVAGKNCSAFLGAIAANYQSNFISGNSECFVVEADEYDRSFHHISATSSIITSVESDHLDIYGDMHGVQQGFQTYVEKMKENGTLFIHSDYVSLVDTTQTHRKVFTYSLHQDSDYRISNIQRIEGGYEFDVQGPSMQIKSVKLPMGGSYNMENALAVIAMATYYGVNEHAIKKAFTTFTGLKRRFETILNTENTIFIDDYAHHPSEIRSFIEGVRELYPNKTIGAVFQPHLYSRTKDYADHFAKSLDMVDQVFIMNIYPAREEAIPGVTSQLIIDEMKSESVELVNDEQVVAKAVGCEVDVLVTIGAGDISKQVPAIKKELEEQSSAKKSTSQ